MEILLLLVYNEENNPERTIAMLFRKKIERACAYCAHGTNLDEQAVLCAKKGIRLEGKPCRKFQYDPLKRTPTRVKALDFSKYDQDDFSL